jgi:hypothetical protein
MATTVWSKCYSAPGENALNGTVSCYQSYANFIKSLQRK